jgi:hypothetical protein
VASRRITGRDLDQGGSFSLAAFAVAAGSLLDRAPFALSAFEECPFLRVRHRLEADTLVAWIGSPVVVIAVPDGIGNPAGKGGAGFVGIEISMPAQETDRARQGTTPLI